MLAAVAAAMAAGELSLREAQVPTPETQALDELMADIAEDVLAEAAVPVLAAAGWHTCLHLLLVGYRRSLQRTHQKEGRKEASLSRM